MPRVSELLSATWDFFKREAITAAFQSVITLFGASAVTAAYFVWAFIAGPLGPLVFVGAVLIFAGSMVAIGMARALRESTAIRSRMAVVSATSNIPDEQKGILDFGAGIDGAIKEFNATVNLLGKDIVRIGTIANKQARQFRATTNSSFAKKRQRAIKLARIFNSHSEHMEERIVRLEQCGSLIDESFPGLVNLVAEHEVLIILRKGAKDISGGIPDAVNGTSALKESMINLRKMRVQQTLNESLTRLIALIDRIILRLNKTKNTCDDVIHIVTRKANKTVKQ